MSVIGEGALIIAFIVAIYAAFASFVAARSGRQDLWLSARSAVLVTAVLTGVASLLLIRAFVVHDFSLKYVADYSSRDLSLIYLISGLWAGQDGSLLLWATLCALFAGIVVLQSYRQNRELVPYVMTIMMALLSAFLGVIIFTSNPFQTLTRVPSDGMGLNPLLQNPGMFMHPPTLYFGYVGFTVPFAFAIAALITGRLGDQWIRSTRRWTLFAWVFLTLGNLFGAQWAYVELGWGGYWGWDPVENASFLPWLTATAFLHSVMIQQRRGMLKVWNMVLIIVTYALTLFGTTIVRSGILSSVHAFAGSPSGPVFIGLMAVVLLGSFWLLWERLPRLSGEHEMDSLVSRESSFLFNNVLLVGAAFAVFWGTVFPFISEAVRGTKIVVGPRFFEQVTAPIFLAMIVVMGICPLIGWRKATVQNLFRNFLYPAGASLVLAVALYSLGIREALALGAFWAVSFVGATILWEFARGVRAHIRRGDSPIIALPRLIWSNKPRYGGYIVHLGVLLVALGIAGSMGFTKSKEVTLAPGENVSIKNYDLGLVSLNKYSTASKAVTAATMTVTRDGKSLGRVVSEKAQHRNSDSPVTEVGIRSNLQEDLYVILTGWTEDGRANIKVQVNPLVLWIWIGGVVMLVGGVVTFWPDAREARRAVSRVSVRTVPELGAGRA